MATTTNGLPYPVGTDPVTQGDDAIKALAEGVDARLIRAYHQIPVGSTLAAGGGTAVYVSTLTIPAAAFARWLIVVWRGMPTAQQTSAVDFILRDVKASNATLRLARSSVQNANPTGLVVYGLLANNTAQFDVAANSTGTATCTPDSRFGGLDVIAVPGFGVTAGLI